MIAIASELVDGESLETPLMMKLCNILELMR